MSFFDNIFKSKQVRLLEHNGWLNTHYNEDGVLNPSIFKNCKFPDILLKLDDGGWRVLHSNFKIFIVPGKPSISDEGPITPETLQYIHETLSQNLK